MSLFKDKLDHINEYFKKEGISERVIQAEVEKTPEALLAFTADRENAEVKLEKFEDLTLVDGVTVITVEPAVEVGAAIVVVTEEGIIPAPVNTKYELPDGTVILVGDTEGMISEVQEVAVEGEDPEGTPAVDEDMGGVNEKVKRLIERVEKVKEFTSEKEEALKKENDFLHGEIAALKDVNLAKDKEFAEFSKVVHETFQVLLGEPEKEPTVKVKNPLAKDEKPNMFHNMGTPKTEK